MNQILFLLLISIVSAEALITCYPGICNGVKCQDVECTECETYVENGGFCGCCPECITYLDEGDQCPVTRFVGGPPPTVKCKDGLICQENEENVYVCTRPRPRTCNN
ncbi:fungal protease inhibitor-1-like [Argiope bruennichi]|uniref:fungal protease inhibitor-1-like n=1 Tax=Argiope bruennichi TaxID=94029 RepID=UPI0024954E47|nr:fungal protease inhibitor-1-like [Argiope bruennichi]